MGQPSAEEMLPRKNLQIRWLPLVPPINVFSFATHVGDQSRRLHVRPLRAWGDEPPHSAEKTATERISLFQPPVIAASAEAKALVWLFLYSRMHLCGWRPVCGRASLLLIHAPPWHSPWMKALLGRRNHPPASRPRATPIGVLERAHVWPSSWGHHWLWAALSSVNHWAHGTYTITGPNAVPSKYNPHTKQTAWSLEKVIFVE